ncbi:MAG: cob(I)yrinic acid a,c-diamide adenosyltransferase [Christensenellaceae bacterium]|jgi:cob(I)alamin adenosyltransferase
MENACIHIYYGDGKGKTSAALGLALRACGAQQKAVFCQFLKNGGSSEVSALQTLGVKTFAMPTETFVFQMTEPEKQAYFISQKTLLQQVLSYAETHVVDVVVFDELLDAIALSIFSEAEIISILQRFSSIEFILTGREAFSLKEYAAYITHMQAEKHPFSSGLPARKGIEF